MKFARILLLPTVVMLLAGCDTTHWPNEPFRAIAPAPTPTPATHGKIYDPGPGQRHDPEGYGRLIAGAAVRCKPSPVRNSNIVHVPLFIEDASGNPPLAADAPLYESRLHNRILAPDGHTVTRAEFDAPRGTATVKCVDNGTQITLQLSGLIPNGVYTAWIVTFRSPGFDPTFARLAGLGTLGTSDGTRNVLHASSAGEASLTTLTPEGRLSVLGKLEECALEDELEFHVVCAYHIDGASWGPELGPNGSAVEQLAFIFRH